MPFFLDSSSDYPVSLRDPFDGNGKPEALRENLSGFWSRRIDDANRLVYAVEPEQIVVIACRYRY